MTIHTQQWYTQHMNSLVVRQWRLHSDRWVGPAHAGTIPPLDKARYVYIGYTIQTVSGLLFVSYIVFCMCSISKYNTLYLT